MEMLYHCTAPVIPPSVDVKIAADSSFLRWGANFSQSEYVAFGAISQFAFPPLANAIHRAFDYVNLSNLCSKQAFHSINLSNVGFIIESQSVRIHVSFRQKPINKLRFEAENSTDPYAFARID